MAVFMRLVWVLAIVQLKGLMSSTQAVIFRDPGPAWVNATKADSREGQFCSAV